MCAIDHKRVIMGLMRNDDTIRKKSCARLAAHFIRGEGADSVQQRLAGLVARPHVEVAMEFDEAQQTRPMLFETSIIVSNADAIEALKKGRA